MRLLSIQPDGGLTLQRFDNEDDLDRYAVLSHVWGSEEITYEDIVSGDYKKKAGYAKVSFMAHQAKKNGLRYFWIDSCCIDKSSSSELSESINSMYRWYQNAEVCFVYLPDVSSKKRKRGEANSITSWEQQFWNSKWFTRGWTLQELIAPSRVEFFDSSGSILGTKTSLKETISSITHIPREALDGVSLDNFSVAQRLSWASSRVTTRVEDKAYSLLGLFDISMPMLYGEGTNAFLRLQQEIIKKTADQTIFAWKAEQRNATHGLLATSPTAFADSHDIIPIPSSKSAMPFALTQLGLQIQLDLGQHENGLHVAFLDCMNQKTKARIGIHLLPLGGNRFLRTRLDQFVTARRGRPPSGVIPLGKRTLFIAQRGLSPLPSAQVPNLRRYRARSFQLQRLCRSKEDIGPILGNLRAVTAVCGMCIRCPARTSLILRKCRFYSDRPFG